MIKNKMKNRKAQEEKRKSSSLISSRKSKTAQEEMVGFALIVVLVSIILVILISIIILRQDKSQTVQSYEAESFIQSILSYTTDCGDFNSDHLSLQQTIFKCMEDTEENRKCLDGRDSCDVLNETLKGIIEASWNTNQRPTKGFKFSILSGIAPIIIKEGNLTGNSRAATQPLIKQGNDVNVSLEIYG